MLNDGNGTIYIKIYDQRKNALIFKEITELIKEMVASQIPISFEIEAIKAQMIITRTSVIRKLRSFGGEGCSKYPEGDLCMTGHCGDWITKEEWKNRWGDEFKNNWIKLDEAMEQTGDTILTLNNKPIHPRFHSTCGGATENSENVEGNKTQYLRKVLCQYCEQSPDYNHSMEMTLDEISDKLNVVFSKASPVEGPSIEGMIEDIQRDEEGRIVSIKIAGKKFKGIEVMESLGLKSTRGGCP